MATYTAQILVGQKHSYDSGIINLSHSLYLSENSRPAWILSAIDDSRELKRIQQRIIWIPTLEHMLEDALVMIAMYVLKDKEILALAEQCFRSTSKEFIELYDDIAPYQLEELYQQSRQIVGSHKTMISVFHGSSILNQLSVLENYHNDIEVCKSVFAKEYSLWSEKYETRGELR